MLKCSYGGKARTGGAPVYGLGTEMAIYDAVNEEHYCVTSPEVLRSESPAFAAMQYPGGQCAAVAYLGADYRSFAMGFPIECIKDGGTFSSVLQGIVRFLLE